MHAGADIHANRIFSFQMRMVYAHFSPANKSRFSENRFAYAYSHYIREDYFKSSFHTTHQFTIERGKSHGLASSSYNENIAGFMLSHYD